MTLVGAEAPPKRLRGTNIRPSSRARVAWLLAVENPFPLLGDDWVASPSKPMGTRHLVTAAPSGHRIPEAMVHLTLAELEAGLEHIRRSPSDDGVVELIVRRPGVDRRVVLESGRLTHEDGLDGDSWSVRPSKSRPDGSPHVARQITVINARLAALVAVEPERRPLAGDQLHLDLDLSRSNLPAGTRLEIGTAIIEVSSEPHRGCEKFAARFGNQALRFVNSEAGRELRLRGLNARVVRPGTVTIGDRVRVDRSAVADPPRRIGAPVGG